MQNSKSKDVNSSNSLEIAISAKNIMISLLILITLIGGGIFLFSSSKSENTAFASATEENGKQIVNIAAKTGFTPSNTQIKANEASILRVKTNNTVDCSSTLVIPSLNISKALPSTGSTDIEIPSQKSGTTLNFTCGMGMYKGELKVV